MDKSINLGSKIRALRKELGLNQTQLAEKLNTTQDTISLWELNKSLPDVLSIIKICKLFDISADYLLELKEI